MAHSAIAHSGRKLLSGFAAGLLLLCTVQPGQSEEELVRRTAKGSAGKDIQIGVYINVRPDCTSGALPAIKMVSPPENGTATVKRAKVSLTNYKNCMALEVPAFIGIYRSRPDFAGDDHLTLTVAYPNGRTETQRIDITVGAKAGGREI